MTDLPAIPNQPVEGDQPMPQMPGQSPTERALPAEIADVSVNKKSVVIETAEMAESVLKAAFSSDADVGRFYNLRFALKTLNRFDKPLLAIFPTERTISIENRRSEFWNTCFIDVAILKKVERPTPEEIDPLFLFAEKILEIFLRHKMEAKKTPFVCKNAEHLVVVSNETLDHNIFLSVVRLEISTLSRLQD
jgi:hypothetical protein